MSTPLDTPATGHTRIPGLGILIGWAILCSLWNMYGAIQIANGGHALGPTASIAGALLALVLAILFVFTSRRWPVVYKTLAGLAAVMAAFTIWNAFILDPALWPSEFWRWAGVMLNGAGVLGAALAIFSYGKDRNNA